MGIESRDIPAGLGAGVRALFLKTIETVPSHYDKLAMVLPSTKSEERYAWLSAVPGMREFIDGRVWARWGLVGRVEANSGGGDGGWSGHGVSTLTRAFRSYPLAALVPRDSRGRSDYRMAAIRPSQMGISRL